MVTDPDPSHSALLRLLQEGEYFPLGSDRPKRLKARVVVATHQNLSLKQENGSFRRDLYYRLCTHMVHVPPLRERKGDLPPLLDHFLEEAARALGKKKPTPPRELLQLLATYSFPGNIRELKALVYNAVSVHRDRVLSMDTFMKSIIRPETKQNLPAVTGPEKNLFAGLERLPGRDASHRAVVAPRGERRWARPLGHRLRAPPLDAGRQPRRGGSDALPTDGRANGHL